MRRWVLLIILSFGGLPSCAYKWGYADRVLPGGYNQVAVPIFINKTEQVGVETFFTNEIVREFARSKVARVTSKALAPVVLVGEISEIEYVHGGQLEGDKFDDIAGGEINKGGNNLPEKTVLTTDYRILITVKMSLKRLSDQRILWSAELHNEKVYSAPQVTLPVVNSVNALYNHSARVENIELIARDMMADAHDRLTENF